MSGIITAGALVGAGALAKGIFGAVQNHDASKIEEGNIRPNKNVDPLLQQNVALAQQQAQTGLPQQVYNNQINGINQNQAGAIASLNNSANPGSSLASIVRGGNAAVANLNAQDAAERNRKTLALMQQRGILADANQNAWNYNYADKYSENLAKSQALRGAGAQNIAGAFNTLGTAGTAYLGNMANMGSSGANNVSNAEPQYSQGYKDWDNFSRRGMDTFTFK